MLEIISTSRFALGDDIMLQAIPEIDHYFAFNTKSGAQFKLNHTAHWVLESINNETNFKELVSKFASGYALTQETAKEDLLGIIQFAFENHIIKEA